MQRRERRLALVLISLITIATPSIADIPVTGRVVDHRSTPIPDAEVGLTLLADPAQRALTEIHGGGKPVPVVRAVTDSQGNYRLMAPDAGMWNLRIDAAGYVPVETILTPLVEETELEDAELEPDAGLRVQVTGPDSHDLAGALVRIEDQDQRDYFYGSIWKKAVRTGTTAGDGNILLPHAKDETLLLSVTADGYSFLELKNVRGTTRILNLTRGVPQTLQIQDRPGHPVAGCLLMLGESGHPAGFTGDDGTLMIYLEGTPAAAYVFARDGRSFRWTLQEAPEEGKPIVIRIPDAPWLAGRVVDTETGQPIEDAFIWTSEERWSNARTNRAGVYSLRLSTGNRTLRCAAVGHQDKRIPDMAFSPVGETRLTIPLDPGGVLQGVVVDPQQRPIPGVELRLDRGMRLSGMTSYWPSGLNPVRSRKDGSFRIAGLDTHFVYRVTTKSPDYASATREFDLTPATRVRKGIRIELTAGITASGSVADSSDRPIAGASVVWRASVADQEMPFGSAGQEDASRSCVTDEQGRFEARGLTPGRADIQVSARGFAPAGITGIEIPDRKDPLDVGRIVLQNGITFTGQVLDPQKRPVEGARIRIAPADPMGMGMITLRFADAPGATTGADGWFRIEDQQEGGRLDMTVEREAYVDLHLEGIEVSQEPVSLTLKPASEVTGVVIDSNGKGIPGATVSLMRKVARGAGGGQMLSYNNREETNSEGEFRITDVPPEIYSIAVKSTGYRDYMQDGIDVPEGKNRSGLRLELAGEALLEGAVTGPDGAPVIGAAVEMLLESEAYFRPHRSRAYTDGDGAYQLHGLGPGKITVQVTHERYPRLAKDLELHEGINRADLRMSGGNTVSGRVVDEMGASVDGADVAMRLSTRPASAITDAGGLFTLTGIPDGDFNLQVNKEGLVMAEDRIAVHVAGAPVDGILVSMRAGATLSGNLIGLKPEEYQQVAIEAYHEASSTFRLGRADYQGTYRLLGMRPGKWEVSATLTGAGKSVNAEVTLEEGQRDSHLDLRFNKGLRLTGLVSMDGHPLPGAEISISGKETSSSASTSSGTDGRFTMEGLEPGQHTLRVTDWAHLNYNQEIRLEHDEDILVTIPDSRVRGRVVDASDGSPVTGAILTIIAANSERRTPEGSAMSSSDGTFEIRNVGPGDWNLHVSREGYAAAAQTVHVPAGQDAEGIDFQLQATEGLTLLVRLPGGAPADRAVFAVLDSSGRPFLSGSPATHEGGAMRISSVPPGTWEILLYSQNTAVASVTASVPQLSPLTVNLQPSAQVHLRLPALLNSGIIARATFTDESGKPFRTLSSWSGASSTEINFVSGDLLLNNVPAGRWSVAVNAPDGRRWTGTTIATAGSVSELVLE